MTRDAWNGLGLILITALVLGLGFGRARSNDLAYRIAFEDAENLKPGDSIYLKGVEVGEITDVDLEPDLEVRVGARVRERFRPHMKDHLRHVIVHDKFLFGKKALLLVPIGDPGKPLDGASVIEGTPYSDLLMEKGTGKAQDMWKDARRWMGDTVESLRQRSGW